MKPEEVLIKLSNEKGYPSFPSFVENEDSIEVYDSACQAMKEYALSLLPSDEEIINKSSYHPYVRGMMDFKNEILNKLKS